jgi:hypothetical protein
MTRTPSMGCSCLRGSSLVELLLALPFLLLLGLLSLQAGLLFHAHHALSYAVFEATRNASVNGGRMAAAELGMAQALIAYLPGVSGPTSAAAGRRDALATALRHVQWGVARQWIELRRVSPTAAAFADWSESARDDNGTPIDGPAVIPNDNLVYRRSAQMGHTGAAGYRGTEPIGASSGLSLADANLLKLEVRYGVRLVVPFVAPVIGWIARQMDACEPPVARLLGLIRIEAMPTIAPPENTASAADAHWRCRFYRGVDEAGQAQHRWPLRLSAIVRMQSAIVLE